MYAIRSYYGAAFLESVEEHVVRPLGRVEAGRHLLVVLEHPGQVRGEGLEVVMLPGVDPGGLGQARRPGHLRDELGRQLGSSYNFV